MYKSLVAHCVIGTMQVGERVKLILDKEQSSDNRWHGKTGTITRITADAAGDVTGDQLDSALFEVELDDVDEQPDIHFRWRDLVPLGEERKDDEIR